MPIPSLKMGEQMTRKVWIWQEIYAEARPVVERLRSIRDTHFKTIVRLAEAERQFKVLQVRREVEIVADAGGEKQIGSNVEARRRNLAMRLDGCPTVARARADLIALRRVTKQYEAEALSLRDALGFYKAALYASAGPSEV